MKKRVFMSDEEKARAAEQAARNAAERAAKAAAAMHAAAMAEYAARPCILSLEVAQQDGGRQALAEGPSVTVRINVKKQPAGEHEVAQKASGGVERAAGTEGGGIEGDEAERGGFEEGTETGDMEAVGRGEERTAEMGERERSLPGDKLHRKKTGEEEADKEREA